jgi:hypothetical protein
MLQVVDLKMITPARAIFDNCNHCVQLQLLVFLS